jgi:hypothetical protein
MRGDGRRFRKILQGSMLHPMAHEWRIFMSPKEPLQIVGTDRADGDELIVEYSDQTTAVYSVDQIAVLKPMRKIDERDLAKTLPN